MTNSLATLATAVSRKRGDLYEGTASAQGLTTTLICNALAIGGDNEFAGDEILLTSRSPVPSPRVTSSTIADFTLTLAPALATVTLLAEAFEKRRKHLYADVVAAINMAITDIAPVAPQPGAADTSLTLASGTYEYTIPVSPTVFKRLYQVELDTDDEGTYRALDPLQWDMRPGGKLWVAENFVETYTGHTIRITGYTDPSTLATRAATTPIPITFILAYCDWYLYGQETTQDAKLLDALFKTKEFERSRAMVQLKPNTKAVLL